MIPIQPGQVRTGREISLAEFKRTTHVVRPIPMVIDYVEPAVSTGKRSVSRRETIPANVVVEVVSAARVAYFEIIAETIAGSLQRATHALIRRDDSAQLAFSVEEAAAALDGFGRSVLRGLSGERLSQLCTTLLEFEQAMRLHSDVDLATTFPSRQDKQRYVAGVNALMGREGQPGRLARSLELFA